jgi:hypothetical protein
VAQILLAAVHQVYSESQKQKEEQKNTQKRSMFRVADKRRCGGLKETTYFSGAIGKMP